MEQRSKTDWAQTAIIGLAAYFVIKEVAKPKPPPADLSPNQAQAEANNLANQMPLSYPLSYYATAADILEVAMGGEYDGTDEDTIYNVFEQAHNLRDVLQLIASFGVRTYDAGLFTTEDVALGAWLSYELDDGEIDEINSILQGKGINFMF